MTDSLYEKRYLSLRYRILSWLSVLPGTSADGT